MRWVIWIGSLCGIFRVFWLWKSTLKRIKIIAKIKLFRCPMNLDQNKIGSFCFSASLSALHFELMQQSLYFKILWRNRNCALNQHCISICQSLAERVTFHLISRGSKGCRTTPSHPFFGMYISSFLCSIPSTICWAHCFGSSRFYLPSDVAAFIRLLLRIGVYKLVG